MLSKIRDYMIRRPAVSLYDLALHLQAQPDAVRGMLQHWIDKGRIRKLPRPGRCAGCQAAVCDPTQSELYEWVNPPGADGPSA